MRPILSMVVVALLFALAAPDSVHADPTPRVDVSPPAPEVDDATVLATAQVFVSEANWRQTPDPAAIVEVLRARQLARGDERLLDTIRAYCPRATGVAPSSLIRMQWISTLRLGAGEPAGWRVLNGHRTGRGLLPLPWSNYENRWRARIDEARALLEEPRDVCPGSIDHWGARTLDRSKLGWTEIRCGDPAGPETINRFWRLPRARNVPRALGARSGPIPRG